MIKATSRKRTYFKHSVSLVRLFNQIISIDAQHSYLSCGILSVGATLTHSRDTTCQRHTTALCLDLQFLLGFYVSYVLSRSVELKEYHVSPITS